MWAFRKERNSSAASGRLRPRRVDDRDAVVGFHERHLRIEQVRDADGFHPDTCFREPLVQ
jgi:hypothetical protein